MHSFLPVLGRKCALDFIFPLPVRRFGCFAQKSFPPFGVHLDSDVVQCKLEPCVSYTFGLAYGEELSTAEKTFVRFTKQRYQECASKIEISNK